MSRTPDPRANGISTNDYCALLPRRRHSYQGRGLVLLLPRTGLVVVPFEELKGGGWYVAVVEGHGSYPVGGHHVYASDAEIETAVELGLGEPAPVRFVNQDEAEALEDGTYILTRSHGGLCKTTDVDGTLWTRSIINKVALRTDEIVDQFPVVIPGPSAAKTADVGRLDAPHFVHTPEEAEALPDRESILTPGGIVFRKWDGYYRAGEATWCRFMHTPITTHLLDVNVHFPAKVLGTAPARESANV
ncbi:hypothetical protein [Arthrobacter sp. UYCo732]|uniref:hypothetical protein n=1 Tax=Arthrobacter sp. UYCo732 TaxID=3156336 RepID=UPI003396424B